MALPIFLVYLQNVPKSWMFLLVAKRLSNQQFKAVKSIMPVNQFFIKIFFKMYLSKLLPQKMHFQNCFFKKYITELAPQKKFFKNCSLKNYIFKSFPQKKFKKFVPSKNAISKLLPQKIHFQNCIFSFCLLGGNILDMAAKQKSFLYFTYKKAKFCKSRYFLAIMVKHFFLFLYFFLYSTSWYFSFSNRFS